MKTDRPPFDDRRVREAFFLIADRKELVDGALSGAGEAGNDLFGKGYEYYADALPQREQDLDRARALLKQAGAEKLKVTLDTSAVAAGFTEAAGIFRDQAAKAGVTIDVRTGSKDSYWSDILDSGTLCCYRSGAMPIEAHISQRLLTDSTTNATKWRHKDFDALYQQAQSTRDKTERAAVYERMQRRLYTEGGFLVWGFADWILGTARKVGGVETQGARQHPRLGPLRQGVAGVKPSGLRRGGLRPSGLRRGGLPPSGLRSFVARRLLLGLAQTVAVVLLVFALTEALPGDAAVALAGDQPDPARIAAIREAMDLDRPAYERLADWATGLLHGDFGTSLTSGRPVGPATSPTASARACCWPRSPWHSSSRSASGSACSPPATRGG